MSFEISPTDMSKMIRKYLLMDQEISFDLFKDIQMGYLTDISMHNLLDL
jgi:hypothetical protein